MQDERWKIVPGYAGRYEVSDRGRVRNIKTGHILRQRAIYYGAFVVPLVRPDLGYTVDARVHMLVAEAFLPNPNGRVYVRHKDGNKRTSAEIMAENIYFGDSKRDGDIANTSGSSYGVTTYGGSYGGTQGGSYGGGVNVSATDYYDDDNLPF